MNYKIITLHPYDLPIILARSDRGFKEGLIELGISEKGAKACVEATAPEHASGYCTLVEGGTGGVFCGIMMVGKKTDYNTMAHEATHMAVKALDWASVDYDADSHEVLAYTIGWIVGEFIKPWK